MQQGWVQNNRKQAAQRATATGAQQAWEGGCAEGQEVGKPPGLVGNGG